MTNSKNTTPCGDLGSLGRRHEFPKCRAVNHRSSTIAGRGFSLVELLVVLIILSLIASTSLVMVRRSLRSTRSEYVITRLTELDALARGFAKRGHASVLRFDAELGLIEVQSAEGENTVPPLRMDNRGLRLAGVRRASRATLQRRGSITFQAGGFSETYVVELHRSSSDPVYLAFLGLSGQSYRLNLTEAEAMTKL